MQQKDLQKLRRIQAQKVEQKEGVERSTLSYMHPLKKCAIDINRGCNRPFMREVKFLEVLGECDKHPKKQVPIWD